VTEQVTQPIHPRSAWNENFADFACWKFAGGEGVDKIYAGADDDAIYAVDGAVDTVNCGSGYGDFAFVDPTDQVTGCENIVDNEEWWVIQEV
jgi:hypothetical protein